MSKHPQDKLADIHKKGPSGTIHHVRKVECSSQHTLAEVSLSADMAQNVVNSLPSGSKIYQNLRPILIEVMLFKSDSTIHGTVTRVCLTQTKVCTCSFKVQRRPALTNSHTRNRQTTFSQFYHNASYIQLFHT